MSVTSVKNQIKAAMQDSFITKAEAQKIVKEAEKDGVTAMEGKAVADLFDSRRRAPPPGMMMTMAIPENPGDVVFMQGSRDVLQTFLDRHSIPAGASKDAMKNRIKLSLEGIDRGQALAKAPNVSRLFPVQLTNPLDVARDLPMQTAFMNLKTGQFYVKSEGGFTRDPRAKFYGPFNLQPVAHTMMVGETAADASVSAGG